MLSVIVLRRYAYQRGAYETPYELCFMLSVIMLHVVMLSVMAPIK